MRGFLDTNDSAICLGDKQTSIDANDELGFEFGFLKFGLVVQVGGEPMPAPLDVENLSPMNQPAGFPNYPWPPQNNPQNFCAGGPPFETTSKLIYQMQRTDSIADLDPFINNLRPDGFTPIAGSLLYMETDDLAYPWLSEDADGDGIGDNDPEWACRKEAIIMIADGYDTCVGGDFANTFAKTRIQAQNLINAYQTAEKDLLGYFIGMREGLNWEGLKLLNETAMIMGTDADGDGDNDPDTYCDPENPGNNNEGDAHAACANCHMGANPECPGNAYFIDTPPELIQALQNISSELLAGNYTLSPPKLAFSADGSDGLLLSYFGVRDGNEQLPVWTGSLDHMLPDGNGDFTNNFRYKIFDPDDVDTNGPVGGQIPDQGHATRNHYTVGNTNNSLIAFNSISGEIPLTDFFDPFPPPRSSR